MDQAKPDLDDTLTRLEKELEEFRRIKERLSAAASLESSPGQAQADAEPPLASTLV